MKIQEPRIKYIYSQLTIDLSITPFHIKTRQLKGILVFTAGMPEGYSLNEHIMYKC